MSNHDRYIEFCPHCGNKSPQRIVTSHKYNERWYDADGNECTDPSPQSELSIYVCDTCEFPLVYFGLDIPSENELKLVWPHTLNFDDSVPKCIRVTYNEALRVKEISPSSYVVVVRRALEEICNDKGVNDSSDLLAQKLKKLIKENDLPPILDQATQILRRIGNNGAHASETKVTPQTAWAVEKLFKLIVEYIYVLPARVKDFEAATKKF